MQRPMERITNKDGETTRPSDGKRGGDMHRVALFVVNIGKSNKILIGGAVHVTCLYTTY